MTPDPRLPLLPVEPRRPRPPKADATRVAPRTVLLAASQPLFRAGMKTLLAEAGLEVVAEACDSDGAIAAAELHRPRVCVMDADLPGGGILTVRRITYRVPETAVVVLAPVVSSELLLAAVRAGANGVVSQSAHADGVMRAVAAVIDGQAAIPRAAIASLIHEFRGGGGKRASIEGRPLALTDREAEVLELLQANLTTAQIARELGLSQVTVRRHLGAISAKAGRPRRADLLRLVHVA